jgi:hypothetical protein
VRFGRPPKLNAHQPWGALARREKGETLMDIARSYGVSGREQCPRDYNSPVFCTRQGHSGTAAREQFADRHKTVARLPTVAGLASK